MGCGASREHAGPAPGPVPLAAETEEQRAAKLAELRRLTPEQEAAAAKAAQRIEEVAAAAEAAPKKERAAHWLWAALGGGAIEPLLEHTPLIDLEYLVALAEGGGVMPCGRQNVPPAAFITKRNLWRLKLWGKAKLKASLGVLVLSYPWLDWFHPDRLGAQLRRLLPFLKAMLAEAKRDSPHCTVGVMIDFLCLPQKPFATEEDGARFGVSLKAINAWYFHQCTYTLLVTNPPPEGADYSNTRLHRDRGWCFFEQAASMVVKDDTCLLDFGAYEGATEFGDAWAEPGTCLGQMRAGRKPPIAPDAFNEQMRARVASGELNFDEFYRSFRTDAFKRADFFWGKARPFAAPDRANRAQLAHELGVKVDKASTAEIMATIQAKVDRKGIQLMYRVFDEKRDGLRNTNDKAFGYGLRLSGSFNLTEQGDAFLYQGYYGDGIGRYVAIGAVPAGYINDSGNVETIRAYGGYLDYRHYWSKTWRSNLVLGGMGVDNPRELRNSLITKQAASVHANLLWNPVDPLTLGGEYLYAQREVENGFDGNFNRVQFSAKYDF